MPFDAYKDPPKPAPDWPGEGMWHNPKCLICKGRTATAKTESCDDCGLYENGKQYQ